MPPLRASPGCPAPIAQPALSMNSKCVVAIELRFVRVQYCYRDRRAGFHRAVVVYAASCARKDMQRADGIKVAKVCTVILAQQAFGESAASHGDHRRSMERNLRLPQHMHRRRPKLRRRSSKPRKPARQL